MDPATALLILKGLLDLLPLATKQVELFRVRGEYSDEEWADVKAKIASWSTDPAWKVEPDPTPSGG